MTSTKDLLLDNGGASAGSAYVPPPIDSSLQGAPGANNSTAQQQQNKPTPTTQPGTQAKTQPATTATPQQTAAPVSSAAASTLQPPPIATPPIAPASNPKEMYTQQRMDEVEEEENKPATSTSDDDDYDKRQLGYWNEYKAKRDKNLGDLMATIEQMKEDYKQPTKEELEKERKKRKREQIFNAIGDGIQALSNLYFTTQYAPNSYNPKNSLSAKAQERYDKIDKEREGKRDKLYNILMNQYQIQNAADKEDADWMNGFEKDKADRAAAKAKAEAANAAAAAKQANADRDYEFKVQKQKDDAERAKARDAEIARHNREQEAIGRRNAATAASKAGGSSDSGRKSFGNYSVNMANWSNDSYINELWSRLSSAMNGVGPKGGQGARQLWNDVNKRIKKERNRTNVADAKRAAIEEVFMNNYSPTMQVALGAEMQDFDERYKPVKKK